MRSPQSKQRMSCNTNFWLNTYPDICWAGTACDAECAKPLSIA